VPGEVRPAALIATRSSPTPYPTAIGSCRVMPPFWHGHRLFWSKRWLARCRWTTQWKPSSASTACDGGVSKRILGACEAPESLAIQTPTALGRAANWRSRRVAPFPAITRTPRPRPGPRREWLDPNRRRVRTARPASRRPGRSRAHLMWGISILSAKVSAFRHAP